MKKITAVICTYNRYDVLHKAIASLDAQTLDKSDYEILIIDNSPDFKIAEDVKEAYVNENSNLKYVIEKIPGLSNARNVASQMAEGEYISFLDDDAIASPQWLEKILEAIEHFENVDIIGGKIDPIWEKPRPNWLGDALLGNVSVVNWGGVCRIASEDEWFAGANITFKTETLLKHGGFQTNLGRKGSGTVLLSNEESALIEQIKADSGLIVYQPEAKVDHLVEEKRLQRSWFRKRASWQAVSDFLMKPEEQVKYLGQDWENLIQYINSMEPQDRNIRALQIATEDPGIFKWQLSAIYTITRLSLSGFDGLDVSNYA